MIQENDKLRKGTDALMDFAANLDRNQIIPYGTITKLSGIARDEPQWNTIIVKLKKRMVRERGIVLKCVSNTGYRLMTVEEQLSDNPRSRAMKGQRQFWRGAVETSSLDDSELSVHLRQVKITASQLLRRSRREGLRTAKQTARLLQPSQTGMPQRKPRKNHG